MRLSTTFHGGDLLFEGDLPLLLRAIPAGAKVTKASVTVAPAQRPSQFHEAFPITAGRGEFGLVVQAAQGWAIVDLGVRRTVEGVEATGLNPGDKANVQLDLGGTWVQLDRNGNIALPNTTAANKKFDVQASPPPVPLLPLPNLTTSRLRVVNLATPAPVAIGVTGVEIVTYPSNLTLRIGSLGPFWFRIGDLREAVTTLDFAPVVQGFLDRSQPVDGVFEVPVILHSDTLARLELLVEVEYHLTQALLAPQVSRVVLPYGYDAVPISQPVSLSASLPLQARVLPGATSARVIGRFDASRIISGPLDTKPPAETVRIAAQRSVAQPIRLSKSQSAAAIDLHVEAVTADATLLVTLQEDVGGKPFGPALLPEPIRLVLERPAAGGTMWASAPLPTEFTFEKDRTYWLIVNAALGEVDWAVEDARGGEPLQATRDGGLSWRAVTSPKLPGVAGGLYRLRSRPAAFRQPITGDVRGHRVSLRSFDALGKVDFALDLPALAEAFNGALADAAREQATLAERVVNGDFARWSRLDRAGRRLATRPVPLSGQVSSPAATAPIAAPPALATAPDASHVYVAAVPFEEPGFIDVITNEPQPRRIRTLPLPAESKSAGALTLAVSPDGERLYVAALAVSPGSQARHLTVWRFATTPDGPALSPLVLGEASPPHRPHVAADPRGGGVYVAFEDSARGVRLLWLEDAQNLAPTSARPGLLLTDPGGQTGDVTPERLLVAPDGRRAYVALGFGRTSAIAVIDLIDWKLLGRAWFPPRLATQAGLTSRLTGLALSGDGTRLFVAVDQVPGEDQRRARELSLIDAATLDRVAEGALRLDQAVLARVALGDGTPQPWLPMATTPDDTRLLLGGAEPRRLLVVDTVAAKPLDPIDLRGEVLELAITSESRRAFALSAVPGAEPRIQAVELDGWTPDHWALTAGRATPVSLPGSPKPTARLGSPNEPTGLSQLFAVSAGRPYQLSFRARASVADARAELFWLNGKCGLLGDLSVEIERPPSGTGLEPHAIRGTAPAGAEWAELRFRHPAGGYTLLDDVSMESPVVVTENGDFSVRTTDPLSGTPVLAGWVLQPQGVPVSSVLELLPEGGIRLSGPGVLTQTLAPSPGRPFELGLRAFSVGKLAPAGHPTVELGWTESQSDPVRYEVAPQRFDVTLLGGTVPADAKGAELVVSVPLGGTVQIGFVKVSQPQAVDVPVTFLSEAPGELTVEAPVVGYELGDEPRPKVDQMPPGPVGCQPTSPEDEPAPPPEPGAVPLPAEPEPSQSYCPCCEGRHPLDSPEPMLSEGGMAGLRGGCPAFGATLTVFPARR